MLISKKKKCLVLRLRDPSLVTSVIPKAKVFQHKGKEFVAVKHGEDEVKVLRNIGINAPSPIKYHYPWPGRFKPFYAQRETADFLTSYRRAFCLNDLGCVDSETEYLSPTGWVKIADYTGGDVGQYHPDSGKVEFVAPTEFVKLPCSEMLHLTGPGVDQLLSPEHRVLWYTAQGKHQVSSAYSLAGQRVGTAQVWLPVGESGLSRLSLDKCQWTEEPSTDGFKYCFMVPSTFLIFRRNGCVFASGNTGKTLSTLWAYDYLRSIGVLKKVIVVSPLSTLERTWADEIWQNFPHLECAVAYGSAEKRIAMLNRRDVDIYLINHDGLKVAGVVESLKNRDDIDLVILDEISQAARNAGTDRYRALNTIINKQTPRWAWGLSGTPIPNKPTDAWAQCRLLVPDKVPAYFNRFRDMVERQVTQFLWVPRQNALDVVHDAMQPAIRFSRDDCVDLPPCQYVVRQVELTAPQKKAYKDMMNKLKAEIEDGEVTAVNEAVKAQKLIQLAAGCVYDDDREIVELDAGPRLGVVREIVEESTNKVIVFVPFVSVVGLVSKYLRESGYSVECVHGAVSKGERDRIFSEFQRSPDPKVLVSIAQTMSHGLTLTAASTIVWYAPITSADTFVQANGRITRPSQKNNQLIVMIEGTEIERRYYDRLSRKQKTQGTLLDMVKGGVIV